MKDIWRTGMLRINKLTLSINVLIIICHIVGTVSSIISEDTIPALLLLSFTVIQIMITAFDILRDYIKQLERFLNDLKYDTKNRMENQDNVNSETDYRLRVLEQNRNIY